MANHRRNFVLSALFTAAVGAAGYFAMGDFFAVAATGGVAMILGAVGAQDIVNAIKNKEDTRHSIMAGVAGAGVIMAVGGYLSLSYEEHTARYQTNSDKNTSEHASEHVESAASTGNSNLHFYNNPYRSASIG